LKIFWCWQLTNYTKPFREERQKTSARPREVFLLGYFLVSKMMTSSQIRQSFLDFFKSKQHTIVPSSSLMPDSPNLLFTNAGMNQFVPIFLGQTKCPYTPGRAADTQKCIRAGGKHNDLDDVGLDTYHHTFFEMLGNWSFGDYFKREAIDWAWELVVTIWKFPPQRLYATVYNPDKTKNDPSEFDQEAWNFWAEKFRSVGLDPAIHIVNGNKKDNFWMMGETGPCGPCSELHVDLTPDGDTRGSLVNKGDARCIEIWNLVFIQFNANPDGTFSPLPAQHVDTGMGFERATSIIQGTKNFSDFANAKISNYETDIFRPIFDALEKLSGKQYGSTLPAMGSTGDSPVPPGYQPGGTGMTSIPQPSAGSQQDAPSHPAGQVAQRDGLVARATQDVAPGATYSKRNLPHFEKPWAIYHVIINTIAPRQLSPAARDVVFDSILHWRESRYRLVAASVMPDHAHFIIQPGVKEEDKEGNPIFWPLSDILHSIKSFSAKEVNKLDNVKGTLWQEERYDRYMRSDADLQEKFQYVCRNPWAAGLVQEHEPWPWLWTPEIEAWKPYVSLSKRSGSTGDSPVPSGYQPDGTGKTTIVQTNAALQNDAPSHSAGLVAPRHGQVARATPEQIALDIAFRVIADHIRTLGFAIADGIQPGNTDRNYVLRRILRRAVRYGRTLGFHEPFFYKLVDVLADTMGDVFPEIRARKKQVQETIRTEEEAFNKTLDKGIEIFETSVHELKTVNEFLVNVPKTIDFISGGLRSAPDTFPIQIIELEGPWATFSNDISGKLRDMFVESQLDFISKREVKPIGIIRNWSERIKTVCDPVTAEFSALQKTKKSPGEFENCRNNILRELEKLKRTISLLVLETATIFPSDIAFKLYDEQGFPLDLTELMARERGLTVDKDGFEKLMEEQRARARAAQKKEVISLSQIETTAPTKFTGFEKLESPARVLEVVSVKDKTAVVLDTSPFYAEMGGQVGDTGELTGSGQLWRVTNTQKSGNTFLHFIENATMSRVEQATSLSRPATGRTERGGASIETATAELPLSVSSIPVGGSPTGTGESPVLPVPGSSVSLSVDRERRGAIQRHHTVTHLLHWALHEVASKEASQKGSFVGPDKLTFDFNSAPLTPAQVADIEKLVNERILENGGVSWTEVAHADVKQRKDVMQFFGDKYGDTVRVVQIGGSAHKLDGYSMELCGGTHTRATGEIGLFRIVSEAAVAAGVRRIEAVAGLEAYRKANEELHLIKTLAGKVNSPVHELDKKIEALLAHQKELEKSLKSAQQREASNVASNLLEQVHAVNGVPTIIHNVGGVDGDFLQAVVDSLKGRFQGVIVLGGAANGAVALVAAVSPFFVTKYQAGKIIQAIAPIVGGKGGGKLDNARGGGKDASKLDEALSKAVELLKG
jgi:alanyl-tRNA synthetase/REP element-mobilizing transposase RayT